MKKSRLILFILSIVILGPTTFLFGQEKKEDPYSDYSHLWQEQAKKKKDKKKKVKKSKNQPPIVASDSLKTKADSLQLNDQPVLLADSLETIDLNLVDQNSITNEPAPVSEPLVDEEFLEEQEENTAPEKTKKSPPDNADSFQDFRAGMETSGGGGSFTGGFTYTQIDDEAFVGLVLSPEFKIGKVGLGLNIPILYGLDSKSIRTEIFKGGAGPARLIRYIRYGIQKKDPVYVKVGQLQNTMIGFGGLINNYTNSTSFEKRKVGLHYDISYKGLAGVEGLYSDFDPASQNLLAVRPYVRPLSQTPIPIVRTLEIGAIVISDKDQTDIPTSDSTSTSYAFTKEGIGAFGLDMGVTLLRVPFIQIDLFANYSKLNTDSDTLKQAVNTLTGDSNFSSGSGFSAGFNFRLHFIADVFSTDIRIERLTYKDRFLPQFFDATYELNKDLRLLSLGSAQKMSGVYGSLTGHVLQKVQLGGSLLIPDKISDTSPAVVQVRADLDRLADKFSFHGSYIKGNLSDLGDAFKFDERSLAKMRFIYHMNSFLATGVDYYWAFTPVADGSYKATKFVMPYFGVSIDF